ncbi:MAG TPA: MFS transporter [Tepidisphaeraceae bacterium]|jgi:MFS family permease|nr:MFS transporter [Tepidisphaeraceae bacterium]
MSIATDSTVSSRSSKWYRGLDRYCWIVLIVAGLGWLFDTMDQNLYNLVRAPSLAELLRADHLSGRELDQAIIQKGGLITSIFLIGWSAGGFIFGILGDRLGRARTMVFTILIYAVFTGLSGLAHSWQMYAAARFATALGVGGEWAAGAALVAETFPAHARPMALGLLQSLSAVGNMIACLITLAMPNLQVNWRWAYFAGALPALLVLWIRRSVREPEQWHEAKASAAIEKQLGRIGDLFANRTLRRHTLAATLLATAGVGALWGIAYFSTDLVRSELLRGGIAAGRIGRLSSVIFLAQQAGAFFGAYVFAVYAERLNRRTAFAIWFGISWVGILIFFWMIQGAGASAFWRAMVLGPIMGFGTLGPFSGYTIYFPELFPTRLRATGCGFCYNAARILAATAPLALGGLQGFLGGYAQAASMVSCVILLGYVGIAIGPETKGRPLPDDR